MSRCYVIAGARIVTGTGSDIESGTVVLRDALIEAVGVAVNAPDDAVRIDGSGLTVYPGLIDMGNTRLSDEAAARPPREIGTLDELEQWKRLQYLRAHVRVAETVQRAHPIVAAWAAAGITSMLLRPAGVVIAGQSALVSVSASDVRSPAAEGGTRACRAHVVKTPVWLHVSLPVRQPEGGIAYPASLMGVVAFVRQAFLDARHSAREQCGIDGLGCEPALDAMRDAVERRLPVAIEANTAAEVLRALRLARELELDAIVTGGREAGDVAVDLRGRNIPVICSLNYPTRPRELAPDADEPLRSLRARVCAPGVPAQLARTGVPFAFSSAGLTDPMQFIANAARAVKAGLGREEAVRALTSRAAALAGMQHRLGTIETGKIANLLVTRGELFDDDMTVACVFVHGEPAAPIGRMPVHGAGPIAGARTMEKRGQMSPQIVAGSVSACD